MRVSRQKTILLLSTFLLTLFSIPITVCADQDNEDDDYEVKARVVRISMLDGSVSVKHNDDKDWEAAKLNYPLVEGDTIATAANSNLEIQVDARNFIRLSSNSVLSIITLRDEGIAISAVEGTVMVRLANYDRSKRGYFEIDAPRSTLAVEKNGLYRVDVPKNGRVRLTVREGGSARIYSDTSGFSLRDGRAAELVVEGDNAGDWDLMAAAPPDAIDNWVAERERYLAQRSKYDVKYYDEYVWGGEDLDAYGDWFKTDDYGWIWRPFPSSISVYSDWAPYRYGQWAWCPPYGWTWIGYEPWGWAPYHYGRWVYYNGYWAWCPRSQFYRNRSWWRPALVAFVLDFSFGDNVCWYPLSYHQRDPHSRRYRHDDRRDRDRDRDRDRRHHDHDNWRGVTRMPRRDFGNPDRRGHHVDEPVARRVVDSNPQADDPPRRGGWGRVPTVHVPNRPTGAAERAPGVALDDDLRRNRVFRGREPRPNQPAQPSTTTPAANTTSTEAQPTGAVARPEPRHRGEPRTEPPSDNSGDRRGSGRPERPRTREGSDNAGGSSIQPPVTTVTEPSRETPRVERRERGTPEVRPESGNESRPRFEPRTEPRSEPRETPRSETPRESPRSETPRSETPRSETPRSETPRSETPRSETPRSETPRSEPRHESPRSESPRSEPSRSESPRSESPRSESPRSEPSRSESPRSEAPRESPRSNSESSRPSKPDKPNF